MRGGTERPNRFNGSPEPAGSTETPDKPKPAPKSKKGKKA